MHFKFQNGPGFVRELGLETTFTKLDLAKRHFKPSCGIVLIMAQGTGFEERCLDHICIYQYANEADQIAQYRFPY